MFADESGLIQGLEFVKAILAGGNAPGWDDAGAIESAALTARREAEAYTQRRLREQELRAAHTSFEAGEFVAAVASFEAAGERSLSARDKRYLYLARKRADPT
jgi:hypothetical protein